MKVEISGLDGCTTKDEIIEAFNREATIKIGEDVRVNIFRAKNSRDKQMTVVEMNETAALLLVKEAKSLAD